MGLMGMVVAEQMHQPSIAEAGMPLIPGEDVVTVVGFV